MSNQIYTKVVQLHIHAVTSTVVNLGRKDELLYSEESNEIEHPYPEHI